MGKIGILPSGFLQRFEPVPHVFNSQKQPDKNKIRPKPNLIFIGSPNGNRTHVTGMRIRCPNR